MSDLDVVAGDLPKGPATYDSGVFRFRKRIELGVESVLGVQMQGTKTERSFGGAIKDTIGNAAAMGPLGLVAGIAFAPAAIPILAIGGAALGALSGLAAGGQYTRAILYVMFVDGRTMTALCAEELIGTIGADTRTVNALAARVRKSVEAQMPRPAGRTWRSPKPATNVTPPLLQPPAPAAALPAPGSIEGPVIDAAEPGFTDHAGRAVAALGDAASVAAANVAETVSGWMPGWAKRS